MIVIRKDYDEKKVTKGVYENIYKPLGYNIVNKEVKKETITEQIKSEKIEPKKQDKRK